MPSATRSVNRKKPVPGLLAPKKFPNRWVIAMIIGTIVIGAFFVISKVANGGGNVEEQAEAAKYLQAKYGKEFAVKDHPNPMVKRALGDPPKFDGLAHAKDDPELTFWVGRQTKPQGDFDDDYLKVLWSQQAEEGEVSELLKEIFGQVPGHVTRVNLQDSSAIEEYYGTTPDFEDIKGKVANQLAYTIDVRLYDEQAALDKPHHLENIYKLVEFMQQSKIEKPFVYYRVYPDRNDERSTEQCNIGGDELKNIRSAEDLSSCLKRLIN